MMPRPIIALSLLLASTAASPAARDGGHSCALVGDSIALEAAQYLRGCKLNAKIGIPSGAVIARVDQSAEINIVSAGSNDPNEPNLRANLERIRGRAKRTIWILPAIPSARAAVREVAARHGDPVVSFAPRGDGVHPASAAKLAQAIDAAIARINRRGTRGAAVDASHRCGRFEGGILRSARSRESGATQTLK